MKNLKIILWLTVLVVLFSAAGIYVLSSLGDKDEEKEERPSNTVVPINSQVAEENMSNAQMADNDFLELTLPGSSLPWSVESYAYGTSSVDIISGFTGPYGITLAPDNFMYISELKEGRVIRMTKDYRYGGWLGLSNDSEIKNPSGWHFTETVVRSEETGALLMPHCVDFTKAGLILVTDYLNHRVHQYSATGEYLGLFFSDGVSDDMRFAGPPSAMVDPSGNIWVADFDGNRIYKFGSDGSLIGWLGARSDGSITRGFQTTGAAAQSSQLGGFYKPHMVQFDADGNFYVVESGNHRVQKFSQNGEVLGWIGAKSDGTLTHGWERNGTSAASALPGGFNQPVSLFLKDDEFIISDNANNRIQKFSLSGKFIGWLGGKAEGGVTEGWVDTGEAAGGTEPGMFQAPYDVKVDDGKLYVADGHNGRVQIFNF